MLKLVEKVEQKFEEYDIQIFDQRKVEDEQYNIIAENMILVIKNENNIGVSFQVSTRPEVVGRTLSILYEIENLKYLDIMESFAFTSDKKLISGDEAYKLLEETMEYNIIKNFEKEKYYEKVLLIAEGYRC